MSLRDLGVFAPLKEDHPLVTDGDKCWICRMGFGPGTRVALRPFNTSDETGSMTVEAKAVCATCHLRGTEVVTPKGRRIVDRVKEGDASPFSVWTTDGNQWRDDEISKQWEEKP